MLFKQEEKEEIYYPFEKEEDKGVNKFLCTLQNSVRTDEEFAKFKGYID